MKSLWQPRQISRDGTRACPRSWMACGRICLCRRKINLSLVFAGQKVGIREVDGQIWLVSFMHYDLGFFDQETGRVGCAPNPFGAKVSPMSPE